MISVVMATYNGGEYIRQQLESILNQTRKPDEIIISDDGSNDSTVSTILDIKYRGKVPIDLYINEKRLGYAQNFRNAINRAKGDIIFLSDQDDVWKENKIAICMNVMEQKKNVFALSTSYYLTDAALRIKWNPRLPFRTLSEVRWKQFIRHPKYPGMAMVFRQEAWRGIDEGNWLPGVAHDWMINQYAAARGGMFYLNKKLVFYRQHENNAEGIILSKSKGKTDIRKSRIKIVDELLSSLYTIQTNDLKRSRYLNAMRYFLKQRRNMLLRGQILALLLYEIRMINYISIRSILGDIYVCMKCREGRHA